MPVSHRLAKPNATCPVCGAAVYFYSNEWGSRVYFDALGPPWPKHPCIDSSARSTQGTRAQAVWPVPHAFRQGTNLVGGGGAATANAWVVVRTLPLHNGTTLHLHRAFTSERATEWFTSVHLSLPLGTLVFITEGRMTFVDPMRLNVELVPVVWGRYLPRVSMSARIRAWLRGGTAL